jgi:hypothetical protein
MRALFELAGMLGCLCFARDVWRSRERPMDKVTVALLTLFCMCEALILFAKFLERIAS